MRKLTLALAAASLLFTLNSAVVARASTPQPLWVGTNVAQLAEPGADPLGFGGAN